MIAGDAKGVFRQLCFSVGEAIAKGEQHLLRKAVKIPVAHIDIVVIIDVDLLLLVAHGGGDAAVEVLL